MSITREEIVDEISGWPIGSGYYGATLGHGEAQEMADAILALIAAKKEALDKELSIIHSGDCCTNRSGYADDCCCQPGTGHP